jgi:hypothetical protein
MAGIQTISAGRNRAKAEKRKPSSQSRSLT